MLLENRKYVERKFNQIQKRSILKKGDLLTNIVGASIGRTALFDLDEVANINQAVALIRPTTEINKDYLLAVLNSPTMIDFMQKSKVDVARANISLEDVSNFPIPLPPVKEQNEIVRRVEANFKLADMVEKRTAFAKNKSEKLTQAILAKAFRGELVPTEAELARREGRYYESASVLLERIRKEKAHQGAERMNNGKGKSKQMKQTLAKGGPS